MMNDDFYLQRAYEIASKVDPHRVAPNPRVGCVITQQPIANSQQPIIAEGVHEVWGEGHAEANALSSIAPAERGQQPIANSTVYISLEPCDHCVGKKTGSCTDLLIEMRPGRVVVGELDPKFGGRSVERLRGEGIETIVNRQQTIDNKLNPFFEHYQKRGRPWVTMKVGQSLDGKINKGRSQESGVRSQKKPFYITGEGSLREVHRMRAQYSAILTTTETVLRDNPRMDCRYDARRDDPAQRERLPWEVSDPKVVVVGSRDVGAWKRRRGEGAKIQQFETLEAFVESEMYRGLDSIMTECGQTMNTLLLQKGLVDEIRMFVAPKILGSGKLAFGSEGSLKDFALTDIIEREGDVEMRYLKQ